MKIYLRIYYFNIYNKNTTNTLSILKMLKYTGKEFFMKKIETDEWYNIERDIHLTNLKQNYESAIENENINFNNIIFYDKINFNGMNINYIYQNYLFKINIINQTYLMNYHNIKNKYSKKY